MLVWFGSCTSVRPRGFSTWYTTSSANVVKPTPRMRRDVAMYSQGRLEGVAVAVRVGVTVEVGELEGVPGGVAVTDGVREEVTTREARGRHLQCGEHQQIEGIKA